MKDLHTESHETLKKEIKTQNIKRYSILRIELILFKWPYYYPQPSIVRAVSIRILMAFFTEIEKDPKISMKPQKVLNSQSNPKKEEHTGGIILPNFKATVIQTVWYWHKNRHIDQWARREDQK